MRFLISQMPGDDARQRTPRVVVQPAEGVVQHEQARRPQQRPGDEDLPDLAVGQVGGPACTAHGDITDSQQGQ